jgi:uncharacterized repeat protein (TIGR01451 family)
MKSLLKSSSSFIFSSWGKPLAMVIGGLAIPFIATIPVKAAPLACGTIYGSYISSGTYNSLRSYTPSATAPGAQIATLSTPTGTNQQVAAIAVDPMLDSNGNRRVYYTENTNTNTRLFYYDGTSVVNTGITMTAPSTSVPIVQKDGTVTSLGNSFNRMGFAPDGTLYIADAQKTFYRFTPTRTGTGGNLSSAVTITDNANNDSGNSYRAQIKNSGGGDIAFDSVGRMYIVTYDPLSGGTPQEFRLFQVLNPNSTTPTAVLLGKSDSTDPVAGLAFQSSDNKLYMQGSGGKSFSWDLAANTVATLATSIPGSADLGSCTYPVLNPSGAFIKTVNNITHPGATLLTANDILEYTLSITNTGNLIAGNVTLVDSIPAGATYVTGTTKLNGTTQADNSGAMPYANTVTPKQINSPGQVSGVLATGSSNKATVVFQVKVNATNTQICNQGTVNYDGGPVSGIFSDDSSTALADDITCTGKLVDFGDAPDTGSGTGVGNYQTISSDNGPNHFIVSGIQMGANIDGDTGSLQNANADADNTNGTLNDEDGVKLGASSLQAQSLNQGASSTLDITTQGSGKLNAWIDWNRDGDFLDLGEQIATDISPVSNAISLPMTVPSTALIGITYARFRYSSQAGLASTGSASDGEVEDYKITITANADLVTTKTGPTTAVAGSTVTYSLSTINNGPSSATNVIVTDNIGIGLTGVVPSNSGTYSSTTGIVTFPTIASLANGATQTYTINVTAPASGSIADTVSSTSATTDPTPGNNNGSATNATVTTVITPSADLITTKTGPTTAVTGSTVTYNLTTLNNGPSAATNVIVIDNIGTGLTGVVASNSGTYNSTTGIVTFPAIASLANGATQTYSISVTAPSSGSITDTVSSSSATADPTPTNNNGSATNATVTTAITPSADLVTTKTGPTTAIAGSTVTYNLTTLNNGPGAATNVIVTDNIGTGLTGVVASNSGTYNSTTGIVTFPAIASLANGATQTYTISLTAPGSGSIIDTVSSTSSTTDPTPGNNDGSATSATVTTTITTSADLVTTKTGPASAVAGSTITYNLSTINNGPSPAANVVVTDNIGTGLIGVVPSNSGTYNSITGVVTFPAITSLANGATQLYTISLTAPGNGTVTDVVSSTSSTSDPNLFNNNGSAPAAQVVTTILSSPNLVLVKRITAITGSSAIQGGDNVALYKDENGTPSGTFNNPYDDNVITITAPTLAMPADTDKWPNPPTFLIGAVNGGNVGPKDEVEYTIYFLSAGAVPASAVTFCDRIPAHQAFIPDAYNALTQASGGNLTDRGIAVSNAGIYQGYTNLTDGDTAQYFAPGSVLPGACGAAANTTGAVVVNLGTGATNALGGTVDNATGAGSPPSSYGFVRFKAKVN